MLFDQGSTFSYVSMYFAVEFDMIYDSMIVPIRVSTPVGKPLVVDRVYRSCLISFAGYDDIPWFHGIVNTLSLSLVYPKAFLC